MQEAESPQRTRNARVVGSIMAAFVALQAIEGAMAPLSDSPPAWWNAVPLALAACGAVLLWRKRPPWRWAFASLLAAIGTLAYASFGYDEFTQTLVLVVAGVFAAALLFAYIAAFIGLWRQGRWPVKDSKPLPLPPTSAGGAQIIAELASRVRALEALGFATRASGEQADKSSHEQFVYLMHERERLVAGAYRLRAKGHYVEYTVMAAVPLPDADARLGVIDAAIPDPFPAMPGYRTFAYPGRSAAELLEIVRGLHPRLLRVEQLPTDEAFIAALKRVPDAHGRWLIDHGYLRAQVTDGAHHYTVKGAIVATLRMLWPGCSIVLALQQREANALRKRHSNE
ncbi:MAG: hypothetical protein IT518_21760 [Burkholderiales bacterium]|nr:hypothetical protein [Burkholderiales bacterium]